MTEDIEISIPEKVNMAWYACDRWAETDQRNSAAILTEDREVSWGELNSEVNRIGNALLEVGLQKGDRVVLRSQNCLELYYGILACMKIGGVPVPTSSLFRSAELQHILNDTKAVVAIVHEENTDSFQDVASPFLKHRIVIGNHDLGVSLSDLTKNASDTLECADTSRGDESFMLYTSGTTSVPKGIVHGHSWLMATGDPISQQEMQLQPGDVTLSVSEINWMYPFGCNFMYPLYSGATVGLY